MTEKRYHDWPPIDARMAEIVREDPKITLSALADAVDLSRDSLRGHLQRDYGIKRAADVHLFPAKFDAALGDEAEGVLARQARLLREGIQADVGLNEATIVYTNEEVRTPERLLELAQIDPEEWEVTHQAVKSYPMAAKNEIKNIQYDGNKKTGTEQQGGLIAATLFHVTAKVRRVNLISREPVLQPVSVVASYPEPKPARTEGILRNWAFADWQMGFRRNMQRMGELTPFHDRRALDVCLQIFQYEQERGRPFDSVSFAGDILDMSEWSTRWTAEPEFVQTTQPALIEAFWWLQQFRLAAPDAEMVMLEGNHQRFRQALLANLQAAYELRAVDELERAPALSLEKMLALDSLHIEFMGGYENGTAVQWLNPQAAIEHGELARSNPGASAGAMVKNTAYTTISFHTHRREMASNRVALPGGGYATAESHNPGCMCHTDGRVPGSKADSNWQQGAQVTEYLAEGPHQTRPVKIEEGRAFWDGQLFEARDRDAEAETVIEEGLARIGG